jgi:hypothetical protein
MVIYKLDREPDHVRQEFLARAMTGTLTLGETLDLSTVSLSGCTSMGAPQQ